jgi:DNA replication protein DnaD
LTEMSKKDKNDKKEEKQKIHQDLEGFDIKINELGEIVSSFEIEKINKFLDKNVEDKKLKDRKDRDEEE